MKRPNASPALRNYMRVNVCAKWPALLPLVLLWATAALPSCSGSSAAADAGVGEGGDGGNVPPPPQTEACSGDPTLCISGKVSSVVFAPGFNYAKVSLFRVYPYGAVSALHDQPVAADGTFAFSNVQPWGHYYVQAVGVFGGASNSVAAVVGPLQVPVTTPPLAVQIKPVFLEVLQQRPTGGQTTLAWASAHLYDPGSGAELTDGSVSFSSGTQNWPMPYASNVAGTKSYFVELPQGTPGGTAFTITTDHMALGPMPKAWNLVGEPATFDGAVMSPAPGAMVPAGQPLAITWSPQPASSYVVVELFKVTSPTNQTQTYISPAADAPDTTGETVPASGLPGPGMYLLNVAYSKATCPVSADGCVYNNSTVAVNLTAQ